MAQMYNRDPDLPDLTPGPLVVRVVTRLGRQVEGDRKSGLALGEVGAIEPVALRRRRMPAIGAEDPWAIALGLAHCRREARLILRRNRPLVQVNHKAHKGHQAASSQCFVF